ncbi:efflux transporter outer membrane subunit [Cupriavidus basilensis]|uniref:efflux transporter outer membrane subunit n=1 Tax=Cupriavidus basilensis TaxID=68895 RepID=UPI0020A66EBC|nr:efflux transporter outer membrane subunit [Cupriavidus basilensis]MCP3024513.1 efflux transporter outer membrane subunit [Cupriavidus basilensis]
MDSCRSVAVPRRRLLLEALVTLAALSGCAVGPDFRPPDASSAHGYAQTPMMLPPAGTADASQHLAPGKDVADQWWLLFQSPTLNDTVARAIADSPTLEAALATLDQARQAITAASGALYPQADLSAGATRARLGNGQSAVLVHPVGNVFSIGPSVSYSPDLFGGLRRQVEEKTALAEFARYELSAAYLSLTGNAVLQAIAVATAREQIKAVRDIIDLDENNVELVLAEQAAGKASAVDVLGARSRLAADRALLPPLEQDLAAARDALTIIVGSTPAEWTVPDFDLGSLNLPGELPVSLPSRMVSARPDILAAQAQLHAASAAIGVATAQLYPQITLTATWTQAAGTMGALFDGTNGLWSVAAGLAAPLLHGGALEAQRQEAIDAFAAQLGVYRQTVLQAFGQVADVLQALRHDAEELDAQGSALNLAQATLTMSQESFKAGQSNFLQVLDAQRTFSQARLAYAKAKGQRYTDTTQLFAAMGGGSLESLAPLLRGTNAGSR